MLVAPLSPDYRHDKRAHRRNQARRADMEFQVIGGREGQAAARRERKRVPDLIFKAGNDGAARKPVHRLAQSAIERSVQRQLVQLVPR